MTRSTRGRSGAGINNQTLFQPFFKYDKDYSRLSSTCQLK